MSLNYLLIIFYKFNSQMFACTTTFPPYTDFQRLLELMQLMVQTQNFYWANKFEFTIVTKLSSFRKTWSQNLFKSKNLTFAFSTPAARKRVSFVVLLFSASLFAHCTHRRSTVRSRIHQLLIKKYLRDLSTSHMRWAKKYFSIEFLSFCLCAPRRGKNLLP